MASAASSSAPMMMDPQRVHAYLQVACAGLGFDIGEVWWTNNNNHQDGQADQGALVGRSPCQGVK